MASDTEEMDPSKSMSSMLEECAETDESDHSYSENDFEDDETLDNDDIEEEQGNVLAELIEESTVPIHELRQRYGVGSSSLTTIGTTNSAGESTSVEAQVFRTRSGRVIRPAPDFTPEERHWLATERSVVNLKSETNTKEPDGSKTQSIRNESNPSSSTIQPSTTLTAADNNQKTEECSDELMLLMKGEELPVYDSDDDCDYEPMEGLPWRNDIREGEEYQADVPEGLQPYRVPSDEPCRTSSLQWVGCDCLPCPLSEAQIDDYLRQFHCLAAGLPPDIVQGSSSNEDDQFLPHQKEDDEEALRLLMECDFNINEALLRYQSRVLLRDRPSSLMNAWKEDEISAFEKGFAVHGKDFFQIMEQKLPHRSVPEIVEFYYVWKKTQRCEEFLKKCGRDRRKYLLPPTVTDYMSCFVLEEDNLTVKYGLQGCGALQTATMVESLVPPTLLEPNTPTVAVSKEHPVTSSHITDATVDLDKSTEQCLSASL